MLAIHLAELIGKHMGRTLSRASRAGVAQMASSQSREEVSKFEAGRSVARGLTEGT